MANFSNFVNKTRRRNSRPQRKTSSSIGEGIMRGVGAGINPLTPTQKAEQERAQRMRQGISPASYVVRSQVGRQITNAPRINKAVATSNRLFGNLRGNALAPVKQTADYTRSQQSKFINTDIQRKGMYNPAAQLMAGKTNIGVEQGKTLRAGMPTSSPLIESWRPTSSAVEKVYRDRYGLDKGYKDTIERRLDKSGIDEDVDAFGTMRYDPRGDYAELSVPLPSGRAMPTAMTVQNGAGVYHVGDSLRDSRLDDWRSSLADAFSLKNPEDVYERQWGKKLDDDTLQRLEQQRTTWGYNAGLMTGQMLQYALTRGALSGLGIVGRAAQAERAAKAAGNLNKARAISFGSELAIDQAASLPLNILDAFKENSPQEVSKRFLMNQGLDVLFSAVTTGVSIANNPAFKEAKALHESANELRASGNNAAADATDMAAYKKMGEVPKEEIELTQSEIRNANNVSDNATNNAVEPKASSNNDAFRSAEKSAAESNLEDFKNQLFKDKQQIAAFKERGIVNPEQIREFWREQKMKGFTSDDIVELPEETAVDILREKFPHNYHQQWFQNENKGVKPHVEEIILSDKELRNAGLNIAYLNHKHTYGAKDMGFQEFLDTPVTFYRGWQGDNKLIDDDVFVSFTTDRKVAEKMAKRDGSIEEITLRPRDTLGSYQTNGEYEFLVPRDTYENVSKVHKTADEVAAEPLKGNSVAAETVQKETKPQQETNKSNSDSVFGKNNPVPTKEQITSGGATYGDIPLKYEPNMNAEARNFTTEIHVSNKFFDLTPQQQRHVLNHEVAHNYADDLMSMHTGDWASFSSKFIKEKETPITSEAYKNGSRTYWEGLYGDIGATSLSETVTRAFTEYLDDPNALRNRSIEAFDEIDRYMSNSSKGNNATAETVTKEQPVAKPQESVTKQEQNPQPEPKAEPKAEPKPEPKTETESPKDGLGRDVFNGGERYHPSGDFHTEKGWKAIERRYEKHSTAWLRKEKMERLPKKVAKGMDAAEWGERAKLIDSLIDEKERYRHGTVKEYNGEKITQSFDTLSHSEKTELIHGAMQKSFIDDGIGRKVGMNPEEAVEAAVSRVEKNVDEVRARLSDAASEAREGKFPSEYRNSQEYYAEVLAYLEHNNSKMEDLIQKGLRDSDEYRVLEKDATNIVSGAMAVRSQEGYGAVQYNLLCHSSGDVRVAIVQKAVDDINEQFEKQLEKAAKKAGQELTDADRFKVTLTDDMIDRIKKVNPDSPLEMNRMLNDISREIWNQVPASGREIWDSIRKTAMLLNPKTHERNFVGNSLMIPARLIKDAIGAPLEKWAISKGKMDIVDASKARINRFSQEYKQRAKAARQIWEEWKDFVTGSAKYFDNTTPTASKLLGKRPIGGWNKLLTAGIENPSLLRKVGDFVIGANGWLLEKADELFLKFHFVDSLVQVSKARNLDLSNLTSDEMQSLIKTATGEAQRATFRDVSEAAKVINEFKAVTPKDGNFKKALSWTVDTNIPFVNVPINVGRRAWDYSPAGLVEGLSTIKKGIDSGNSKQVKKAIDKIASGTTGTGIFVAGVLLGRSGGATATLSSGKRGYYEQDQGKQEYSINIEGEDGIDIPFIELKNEDGISISLSPFAPWSIPFFAGVEAGNAIDGGKINWKALLDVAGGALAPMLDMSVLQGPADTLASIRNSEDIPSMFINLGLTTITNHYMQYVPTIMGQFARVQDPVRRDTTSYQEDSVMKNLDKTKMKFISKIPSTPLTDNSLYNISSTSLNPYLDAWGREQKTFADNKAARFAYEFFSPTYVKQRNVTALDKEINRLNDLAANEDEYVIPTKSFNTALSLNGDKVQLDRNDIYEYNKVKGAESYRKASKLIETDEYRNATAQEQRDMLNKVFKEANTEAKQQTLLKKGIDEYTVYTDGFTGGKAEQANNAKAAGIKGKDYYTTLTDKAADADGNGSISQVEFYDYLSKQNKYTNEQKAILWRAKDSGWSEKTNPFVTGVPPQEKGSTATSNAQYTAEMKESGLTEKQFAEVTSADNSKIDSNGSGRVSQAEYQAYLDSFGYLTDAQKSLLWKQYNPHWKKNPYDGSTASSGSSKRSRSGRRSGGGSSKSKARAKTASEKRFAALQTGKAPTNVKGIEALSSAKGLTKAQKKALVKLMQKKLDV